MTQPSLYCYWHLANETTWRYQALQIGDGLAIVQNGVDSAGKPVYKLTAAVGQPAPPATLPTFGSTLQVVSGKLEAVDTLYHTPTTHEVNDVQLPWDDIQKGWTLPVDNPDNLKVFLNGLRLSARNYTITGRLITLKADISPANVSMLMAIDYTEQR